jgi:hypothetical protein
VYVYHVTLASNLLSIRSHGLLVVRAKTSHKWIWLCSRTKVKWAVDHLRAKRPVFNGRLVVLMCDLPQNRLIFWRRGIYATRYSVESSRVRLCRTISPITSCR